MKLNFLFVFDSGTQHKAELVIEKCKLYIKSSLTLELDPSLNEGQKYLNFKSTNNKSSSLNMLESECGDYTIVLNKDCTEGVYIDRHNPLETDQFDIWED